MLTIDTRSMSLMDGHFTHDPSVQFRANFVVHGGLGSENSAAVLIELEPGKALGEHTDSPEEVLLVLAGEVEFRVGEATARGAVGTLAVVPSMIPHAIRNVGDTTARVIGFFPSSAVVATFVEPVQPLGENVLVFGDASVGAAS